MQQEVKEKYGYRPFLITVFLLLFITLLQFQRSPGRRHSGLEAASNLAQGRVGDRQMPMKVLLNSGRWSTLPAGWKELNPAAEKCRIHNKLPTERAGSEVRPGTNIYPPADNWLDELVDRIRQVESSGQVDPPDGDGGRAVGPLQLHKCVIDDVNHWYGTEFSYADRHDVAKSKSIAKLYVAIWLQIYKEEIAARIYNGGPRGWQKKSTDAYWQKIQKAR